MINNNMSGEIEQGNGIIADVSGQIELLIDFCYWLNTNRIEDIKDFLDTEEVEEFLKSRNIR